MDSAIISDLSTFALLVGLELILGIDNVLLISILSARLPKENRKVARILGLGLALVIRIFMVMGAGYLTQLTDEVIFGRSWKELILLAGGAFLLFKSVKEIHHAVEGADDQHSEGRPTNKIASVVAQIVLLDIVFSIDSVITAVGLTSKLVVIEAAVVVSFVLVLFFANRVSNFIQSNPALKVLALAFLVCIGITLGVEGMGHHVDKGYIYLPMAFAFVVELLQMRQAKKSKPKN